MRALSALEEARRAPGHQRHGLQRAADANQLLLVQLEAGQWPSELATRTCVGQRATQHAVHDAHRQPG